MSPSRSALRVPIILAAAMAVSLVGAPGASAATTLGQLFAPTAACNNIARLQVAASGTPYEVPSKGVITSWSFQNGAQPVQGLKFKVGHPGGGTMYTMIGEGAGGPQTANTVTTHATRVPVVQGDYFGIYAASGQCYLATTFQWDIYAQYEGDPALGSSSLMWPYSDHAKIPVQVKLEADPDNDGFGNETQDLCPATAGTENGCPPEPPPPPAAAAAATATASATATPAAPPPPPPPPPTPPPPDPGTTPDPGPTDPGPGSDAAAPVLDVGRMEPRKGGFVLSYTLSEQARVVFTVARRERGVRLSQTCVRRGSKARAGRSCTRFERVGSFARDGSQGTNLTRLSRRIGSRRLAPGRYRVTVIARDAAGNVSGAQTIRFRVARR